MPSFLQAIGRAFGLTKSDSRNTVLPLKDDGFALKYVQQFSGIVGGYAKAYRSRFDEALKDSEENARAMLRDTFIRALLQERMTPVARAKWHIEPEDDKDFRQLAAVKTITKCIEAIPYFTDMRTALLWNIWHGKAAVQIVCGRPPGQIRATTVTKWQPVHGDGIVYRWDGTPGILVQAAMAGYYRDRGAEVLPHDRGNVLFLNTPGWRDRFIIANSQPQAADFREPDMAGKVHGVGLRDQIYWYWNLKNEVAGYLLDHLARIGAGGMTIITYESGNPASEAAAQTAAQDLQSGNVLLVPRPVGTEKNSVGIERIEPTSASASIITELVDNMFNQTIERIVIGQTMSSGADNESGLGGSGRAEFAKDTKHQLLAGDCQRLDECLTEQLVGPLVRWNCPGADFRLKYVSDLESPDSESQLAAVEKAYAMGVDFIKDEVRSLTGLSAPKDGDDVISKAKEAEQGGLGGMMGGPPGGAMPPDGDPAGLPSGDPMAGDDLGGEDDIANGEDGPEGMGDYFTEQVNSGRLFDPEELPKILEEIQSGSWQGGTVKMSRSFGDDEVTRLASIFGLSADDVLMMARQQVKWSPFVGKDGRSGWKSERGRVVYKDPTRAQQQAAPEQAAKADPEAAAKAQASPDAEGKPDAKPAGTQRGKKGQSLNYQKRIEGMLANPSKVTPENMKALCEELMGLTTNELQALRRQYEGKYARKKADVRDNLVSSLEGKVAAKAEGDKKFDERGFKRPGELLPQQKENVANAAKENIKKARLNRRNASEFSIKEESIRQQGGRTLYRDIMSQGGINPESLANVGVDVKMIREGVLKNIVKKGGRSADELLSEYEAFIGADASVDDLLEAIQSNRQIEAVSGKDADNEYERQQREYYESKTQELDGAIDNAVTEAIDAGDSESDIEEAIRTGETQGYAAEAGFDGHSGGFNPEEFESPTSEVAQDDWPAEGSDFPERAKSQANSIDDLDPRDVDREFGPKKVEPSDEDLRDAEAVAQSQSDRMEQWQSDKGSLSANEAAARAQERLASVRDANAEKGRDPLVTPATAQVPKGETARKEEAKPVAPAAESKPVAAPVAESAPASDPDYGDTPAEVVAWMKRAGLGAETIEGSPANLRSRKSAEEKKAKEDADRKAYAESPEGKAAARDAKRAKLQSRLAELEKANFKDEWNGDERDEIKRELAAMDAEGKPQESQPETTESFAKSVVDAVKSAPKPEVAPPAKPQEPVADDYDALTARLKELASMPSTKANLDERAKVSAKLTELDRQRRAAKTAKKPTPAPVTPPAEAKPQPKPASKPATDPRAAVAGMTKEERLAMYEKRVAEGGSVFGDDKPPAKAVAKKQPKLDKKLPDVKTPSEASPQENASVASRVNALLESLSKIESQMQFLSAGPSPEPDAEKKPKKPKK